MTKLNKYQKLILILYGISFIYFSVIHVPFKVYRSNEIVYDTLFSERANLDISRLILILIVISVAFTITLILINSLHFNLKFQSKQKLKPKTALYILLAFAIIAATILIIQKKKNLPQIEKIIADSTVINSIVDTTITTIDKGKKEPSYYNITNVKFYSNERFQEFVSFTLENTSTEVISNIMFKEEYFPAKHKKNDFTNKPITLQPKDSTKFTFKKNHDELFVYKIRFASGQTITFDAGPFDYDNMIYTKFGESKD